MGRKDSGTKERTAGGVSGSDIVAGRNAVTEALKGGRHVERVYIAEGSDRRAAKIRDLAAELGVPVRRVERKVLDRMTDEVHQGVAAVCAAAGYASIDDIFSAAREKGEDPFIIILDGIEDPRNLGAIMRTAECAGAHGIITGRNRAAGLTAAAAKASAGAVEYMKVARTANIARTIDGLKERGLWIFACDMDGQDYTEADLGGAAGLVIGNEGSGISRLVKEKCDFTVSIPMFGRISSLNASNAAAVLMYEVVRQRRGRDGRPENPQRR